jgi:outer membrane protein assembly factor BamE
MAAMRYLYLVVLALSVSGCSLSQLKLPELKIPRVYKLTVQQGNVITQQMVDRLEPGMSRSQVEYVMGRPVLQDPFNDDQWVYIYSIEIPDYLTSVVKLVLDFDGDTLTNISGDIVPSKAAADSTANEGGSESTEQNAEESAEEAAAASADTASDNEAN